MTDTPDPDPFVQIDGASHLISSGLLWRINHFALHPVGLALAVEAPFGSANSIKLSVRVASDAVWEFTPDDDKLGSDKFAKWMAQCGPEITSEDWAALVKEESE